MVFPFKRPFFRAVANGSWLTVAIAFRAGATGMPADADGGTTFLLPGSSLLSINGNSPDIFPGRGGSLAPRLLFEDPLAKVSLEAALSNLGVVSVKFQPSGSIMGSEADASPSTLAALGLDEVRSQPVERINAALMPAVAADVLSVGRGSLAAKLPDLLANISPEAALPPLPAVSVNAAPSASIISWLANQPPAGFEQDDLNLAVSLPAGPLNAGLESALPAATSVQALVLDSANAPSISIATISPNLIGIEPAVVIPEPGSLSLFVVGLAVMGLVYRFQLFPRKFSYFVSDDRSEACSVTALPEESQPRYIPSEAIKLESRSRFDFFAVEI